MDLNHKLINIEKQRDFFFYWTTSDILTTRGHKFYVTIRDRFVQLLRARWQLKHQFGLEKSFFTTSVESVIVERIVVIIIVRIQASKFLRRLDPRPIRPERCDWFLRIPYRFLNPFIFTVTKQWVSVQVSEIQLDDKCSCLIICRPGNQFVPTVTHITGLFNELNKVHGTIASWLLRKSLLNPQIINDFIKKRSFSLLTVCLNRHFFRTHQG